jgi:hypothetical protein
VALLLALLMAALSPVEGVYVAQARESATALELEPDGSYRWFYSHGALDLTSEGKWARDGDALVLTSDPVTPPSFSYSGAAPGGNRGVVVRVLTASGQPIPAVDVLLHFQSGKRDSGQTDGEGQRRIDLPAGESIQHIALALPAFELRSEDYRLSPKPGEILTFQLEPNDLGKQAFAGERLKTAGASLKLRFRGTDFDYQRQEGGIEEVP